MPTWFLNPGNMYVFQFILQQLRSQDCAGPFKTELIIKWINCFWRKCTYMNKKNKWCNINVYLPISVNCHFHIIAITARMLRKWVSWKSLTVYYKPSNLLFPCDKNTRKSGQRMWSRARSMLVMHLRHESNKMLKRSHFTSWRVYNVKLNLNKRNYAQEVKVWFLFNWQEKPHSLQSHKMKTWKKDGS